MSLTDNSREEKQGVSQAERIKLMGAEKERSETKEEEDIGDQPPVTQPIME